MSSERRSNGIKLYKLSTHEPFKESRFGFVDVEGCIVHATGSLNDLLELSWLFSESAADLVGVVSVLTLNKAGISTDALQRFLIGRPGYSVYFLSSAVAGEVLFENVWTRAVFLNKQVSKQIPATLKAFDLASHRANRFAAQDFWLSAHNLIATPVFWRSFHRHLAQGLENLKASIDQSNFHLALLCQPNPEGLFPEVGCFSILADPLLTEFVGLNIDRYRSLRIRSARLDSMLDDHCMKLLSMRTLAVKAASKELYACWRGYRNLYLKSQFDLDFHANILNIASGVVPIFDISN